MAQLFTFLSILIMLILSIACFVALWHFKREAERKNVLIPNGMFLYVGVIGGVVFAAFALFASLAEANWYYGLFFSLFVWLCIYLLYGWGSMITVYDEDGLTVGCLPGQKKYYRYEEFTSYKDTNSAVVFLKGKKKVTFDYRMLDCHNVVGYIRKQYKLKTGKELEKNTAIPSWDVFNGHVDEPEIFLIMYIVFTLFIVGFCVWMLVEANSNVTEKDTVYMEAAIVSYEIDEDSMVFHLDAIEGDFFLYYYEKYEPAVDRLLEDVKKGQVFCINSVQNENSEDQAKYEIFNITAEQGETYISYEDVNRESRKAGYSLVAFFGAFLVLWIVFCVMSIVVGRNPHKYSTRVLRLFFKDGYVH